MGFGTSELSISLAADEEMARLNLDYLGRQGPTNVISFGQEGGPNPAGVLGDVVVNLDYAQRMADEAGRSRAAMVDFYLIHGILHLAGYDHENAPPEQVRLMEEKQKELLALIGRPDF